MAMINMLNAQQQKILNVVRIVSGPIFFRHGVQNFLSFPPSNIAGSGLAFAKADAP